MATAPIGEKLLTADEFLRLCEQRVIKGELVKGVVRETVSAGGEPRRARGSDRHRIYQSRSTPSFGSNMHVGFRGPARARSGYRQGTRRGVLLRRKAPSRCEGSRILRGGPRPGRRDRLAQRQPRICRSTSGDVARVRRPVAWAVYPVARTVAVHPLDGTALLYTENDILDGGAVLPDFHAPCATF